jgi:endonuclease/exonuclease/phosphatase family metal-dependent hydrolase
VAAFVVACQDADPSELRVISYNVKGVDWQQDNREHWPEAVALENLVTTLQAHPADIIGLQEVREKYQGTSLADELAEALGGYHVQKVTTTSIWLPYLQQNAILCRHELLDQASLDLGEDPGGTEHRQFQYARIELPGGDVIHLGNVHLFTVDGLHLAALEAIGDFVGTRVGPDDHFIWTGDFNFQPLHTDASSPYNYVIEQFETPLDDPLEILGHPVDDPQQHTSSAATPVKRIDYIFISPTMTPLTYRPVFEPLPSKTYPDHLAVQTHLLLESR